MGRKGSLFSLGLLLICGLVFAGERSDYFQETCSDPADSGFVRMCNGSKIAWENYPTGTDITLGVTDVSNWNTAYGWGNHASAGYLTGVTADSPLSGAGTSASHLVIDLSAYVPYGGASGSVDLGIFNLTANNISAISTTSSTLTVSRGTNTFNRQAAFQFQTASNNQFNLGMLFTHNTSDDYFTLSDSGFNVLMDIQASTKNVWFPGLSSNGFVKTSGGTGLLSVDTTAYLSGVTADSPLSGAGTPASHLVLSTAGTWAGNAATATTASSVTNLTLTTALTNQGGAGVLAWPVAGATLTIPSGGGTLGSAAFTASTAYDVAGAAAAITPTTLGLVIGTNVQAYNSNLTAINQALTSTSSPSFTTVTAALSGNATTATTATNFSGSLSGDVTGTQGATSVGKINGVAYNADPLAQYALLVGRSGGQQLDGGTASGNNLTLMSTSHATKGKILFGTSAYDEVNNRLGIGGTSPTSLLDVISGNNSIRNFPAGGGGTTPEIALGGTGVKSVSLLTGTNGSAFVFDDSGFFVITKDTTANIYTGVSTGGTELVRLTATGGFGIGLTPSAVLHVKAGTAAAGTAPFKLTSGTNLTAPEAGAMEYNGTSLFFTPGATRYNAVLNNLGLSGGQTLIGGTAASNNLVLNSTSNATKGTIDLDDAVRFYPSIATPLSSNKTITTFEPTLTINGSSLLYVHNSAPTVTFAAASPAIVSYTMIREAGTYTATANPLLGLYFLFVGGPTLTTATTNVLPYPVNTFIDNAILDWNNVSTATGSATTGFYNNATVQVRGSSGSGKASFIGFQSRPQFFATTAGGALNVTSAIQYYAKDVNYNITGTVTVPSLVGFQFDDHAQTSGNRTVTALKAFWSKQTAGTGVWGFYDDGGANHALKGNVRLGDNTAPTALLDLAGLLTMSNAGLVTRYNNVATVSQGIPSEVATIDTTGLTANVGVATLYAVPAAGVGMYRISAYVTETTAGSLSSTLPNVQIVYTDADSSTVITIDATPILGVAGIGQTGALTANTVGTTSSGVIVVYAKASTNIQYQTTGYASNLAGMAYTLRIKLEAL